MSRLLVIPPRPRQLDLLACQRSKSPHLAPTSVDFGVGYDELANEELRDEVLDAFAQLPEPYRRRIRWALRLIAAAPDRERLRAIEDIEDLATRSA